MPCGGRVMRVRFVAAVASLAVVTAGAAALLFVTSADWRSPVMPPAASAPALAAARPKPPATLELRFDFGAREALRSIGVEREVASVWYQECALNRLHVPARSLNPRVPNLGIEFVWAPEGWRLSGPRPERIERWLKESAASAGSRTKSAQ